MKLAGFCEIHYFLVKFAIFHGSATAGHDCCRSAALQAGEGEQTLEELTRLGCTRTRCCFREHPGPACGTGRPGRGQPSESGQLPGIVRRVWEQMCCSSGISAHSCGGLRSFRLPLVPFLSFPSLCRGDVSVGGGRTCTRGLCLPRWVLGTCFSLCLDGTRVLTLPLASETSNPNWPLFVRGADR